jgi:hypothetical protein
VHSGHASPTTGDALLPMLQDSLLTHSQRDGHSTTFADPLPLPRTDSLPRCRSSSCTYPELPSDAASNAHSSLSARRLLARAGADSHGPARSSSGRRQAVLPAPAAQEGKNAWPVSPVRRASLGALPAHAQAGSALGPAAPGSGSAGAEKGVAMNARKVLVRRGVHFHPGQVLDRGPAYGRGKRI